jgi:hypothetical protein
MPAAWEHKFVEIASERKAFESTITQHGKDGWEYAGSERFDQKGLVLVFKKRKGDIGTPTRPNTIFPIVPSEDVRPQKHPAPMPKPDGKGNITMQLSLKNANPNEVAESLKTMAPRWLVSAEPNTEIGAISITITRDVNWKYVHDLVFEISDEKSKQTHDPFANSKLQPAKKPEPMFQVFNLKFATAAELTEVLQRLFPEAKMVVEKRTNAIIVLSADTENLDKIRLLIGRLDVEVVKK